jgi:hypothetical protein
MKEKLESYYTLLDQWLKYYGFEPITVHADAGVDKVFRRSRVEATKFGKVDAYVCVKYMHEGATGDEMKTFSEKMFDLASRHRAGGIPLGFGAMMVVYPLLVTDNISNELAAFINTYCPKHFAAAEFPSVLDLSSGHLYFYSKTPIWGYAYYSGYRREVYSMFSPKSWEQTAGKK